MPGTGARASIERTRAAIGFEVAVTVGAGVGAEVGAGDSTGAGAKLLCCTLSAAIYIHFPLTDIRFPAADSRCFVRLHFHKHVLGF